MKKIIRFRPLLLIQTTTKDNGSLIPSQKMLSKVVQSCC